MGISIYYSAERTSPLTASEKQQVSVIIEEFNQAFELRDEAESLDLYEYDEKQAERILSGSTKLPIHQGEAELFGTLTHWLKALTAIRHAVTDASWHVHLDDIDLIWQDEQWKMPL